MNPFFRRPSARLNDHRVRPMLEALEDRNLLSTLSGVVFNDANNNGVMDAGEAGVAAAVVRLTGKNDLNQNVNLTQTAGADGSYSFANLCLAPMRFRRRSRPVI